jgi:hypothetical protein
MTTAREAVLSYHAVSIAPRHESTKSRPTTETTEATELRLDEAGSPL